MAVLLVIIPICLFAAERLNALLSAVLATDVYIPSLCLCACACVVAAWVSHRNGIKNKIYLVCTALGIPVGLLTSDITCAEGILPRIGGGMLICLYVCVLWWFFSGIKPKRPSKQICIFTLAVLAAANICAALYAASCEYIYYWDNAIYWTFARDIAGGSIKDGFFSQLYNSMLTFDYNYLAALPPALFAYIFGTSRTVYIFAVINCFFVPCVVAVYAFTKDILRSCIILLALPVLLFLALTGFVDVVGFALCMACFALYSGGRNSQRRGFAIGVLLAVAILTRRWYAFFALSFVAAMAVDFVVSGKNQRCLLAALCNVGFILVMFFSPLVINKLLFDYSGIYAGYKFTLTTDIKLFTRYFGVLPALLIAAGSVWCVLKKDKRVIMPIIQMAVCFVLFVRTQTHGQQHLLLYIPSVAVLMACILEKCSMKAAAVVLAGAVCISANTLVDRVQPQSLAEIDHYAILPDFSMRGRTRDDAQEILELKNRLDELYSDGWIGVNVSSFIVNADILKNVQPSLGAEDFGVRYIEELPCVDSRDTDLSRFYEMDYILTASPVQVHLGADRQTLVANADKCLREGIAFGNAYQKEDFSYNIGDIEFSVYKRVAEVTDEQKAETEKIMLME